MASLPADLVNFAFGLLKDATNTCFSTDFRDCWRAVASSLGEPLSDGTLVEHCLAAAAVGNAQALFVTARLIRAKRLGWISGFNLPRPLGGWREEMHRLLKAAAKQGLAPALRKLQGCVVRVHFTMAPCLSAGELALEGERGLMFSTTSTAKMAMVASVTGQPVNAPPQHPSLTLLSVCF